MSETTSAATGRCFGIQRVCQVWERSRSALYARRARAHHHRLGAGPARRGPPPRQSDAQLLAAIRTDLARSPFHGEGHRKVHARLRILDGIRVARPRVLRVMRAHGLLSPHRGRQGAAKTHDGRVITQAPNVMWGTDGVRVFTLDDGWGWIFAAVEHWNAECMWYVCKARCNTDLEIPNSAAARRMLRWAVRSRSSMGMCTGLGPRRRPLAFARANPARTRSAMRARSNSAMAAKICICSFPAGVVASMPSCSDTNATPNAWSSSSSVTKCFKLRPNRYPAANRPIHRTGAA